MSETSMPGSEPQILTHVEGQIGVVTIDNAPRRNAVTLAMWRAIPHAMSALDTDDNVRVIVLRGAGDTAFVSGADISEFADIRRDAESARAYEADNMAAFRAVRDTSKPTIAMITGPCIGGGLGLALACDMRIAGTSAHFAIPASKLGLAYPPDGMADIVAAVGPARAKELFFTARRVKADEALQIGLVGEVVADEDLPAFVETLALTIAANAPLTIRAAKAAIASLGPNAATDAVDVATRLADAAYDSADFREGCAAFLEKRKPKFKGY
jgi:enoyl-CoA hydratase/carnithine racemase